MERYSVPAKNNDHNKLFLIDINECNSFPCKNGGECFNSPIADFTCACALGWEGKDCTTSMYRFL